MELPFSRTVSKWKWHLGIALLAILAFRCTQIIQRQIRASSDQQVVARLESKGMQVVTIEPQGWRAWFGNHDTIVVLRVPQELDLEGEYVETEFVKDVTSLSKLDAIELWGKWLKEFSRTQLEDHINSEAILTSTEPPDRMWRRIREHYPQIRFAAVHGRFE